MLKGWRHADVAKEIGCSTESLRLWARAAERRLAAKVNSQPTSEQEAAPVPETAAGKNGVEAGNTTGPSAAPTAPKDPGAGLSEYEVAAILQLKQRHPTMGPAQIRAQLKRFKGWRLSVRAIARALKQAGYALEHRGGRPDEPEPPRRWEAPYRNALWQVDFTELRLPEGRRALGVVLDDFSRFVVAWGLFENPTSEDVVRMLKEAIRLHGKPLSIYTDRAGPFLAWGKPEGLQRFLEEELIDHHVSRAYRPQGRGKVESVLGTVKRELWEVEHFPSEEEARAALSRFFHRYNHGRAHLGLDGLTPADRFFGRWEAVLALIEAQSRKRQGLEALSTETSISKDLPAEGRAEILRLLAVDGELELRFFGHRVRLGKIES
jgi:transposase InsO family protein